MALLRKWLPEIMNMSPKVGIRLDKRRTLQSMSIDSAQKPSVMIRCPICNSQFDPRQSMAMPFCGERCRTIDLGRWLGETYAVPSVGEPEEEVQGADEQ
jgi:endogenous inhibitor of DNA gyrase (YacG/DUF329 family)